ncbi:carboxymuconolactone decarboxylase family protein [Mycolicibacterium hodleri]|uniref:Carboxymuconolactone decarboxylase family protein n=1 Tax=Mycolicibacterium hodleri TaxID=49897 RepID=A0A502E4X7_9MYCO|nr:carboxymuconolactone decarboxylase family protein [Mycolicibacterium hodleri]TPG31531.1 carboxymuconolactone decarboxylase family protein [Mycolicibacterium hodleri]
MSAPETAPARIPPGGFRELGPLNWIIAKVGARAIRAPRFSLVNVMGQHRLLFLVWGLYGLMLLAVGKLSRKDAEVVILRVGHLRNSEYELQQHRRLARSRGIDADLQAKIFEGPDADGLIDRHRVLITATDEFVMTRSMSAETWAAMTLHYTRKQLIEFCLLAANYDGLAATIATLKVPLDFPD